jgi:hypothetical protein
MDALEADARAVVQESLVLLGYERTQEFFRFVQADVVRKMWRVNGGFWTQQEISELLDVSREWVNRLVNDAERKRRPESPPGAHRIEGVVFTVLSNAGRALELSEIVARAGALMAGPPDAWPADTIAARCVPLLGYWASRGLVVVEAVDGRYGYRVAPHVREGAAVDPTRPPVDAAP